MPRKTRAVSARTSSRGARSETRYPAAEFKATCLELMDRVRETRAECFFGSLKGSVLKFDRPFDRIEGDYDMEGD